MARTHCGRKSGVLECMEKYPYWMLAVMIFMIGFLHYSVLHINMQLTKLTSLFLDVPPLFMVMLLLIAAGGCTDPNKASPAASNTIMRSPSTASDGSGKESSTSCKESTACIRRRRSSRSWPSWDWLQPYDPELFLRFDRKEHCKEGSKGGETDGRSSGITHGSRELKGPESNSSLEETLHSSLPSQDQVIKCKSEDHHQLARDQYAKVDVLLTDEVPKREGAPKEDFNHEKCCTAFTVDTLNPVAVRGDNPPGYAGVEKFGHMHTNRKVEFCVPLTGGAQNLSLDSILRGDNILTAESSHTKVDPSSKQLSFHESDIMIKPKDSTSMSVRFDPELLIKSTTKVLTEPDEHGDSEQESLNACFHDRQLISVGSLKDWDQFLPGGTEEISQGPRDANEIVLPTTSFIMSDSVPRTRKGEDPTSPTWKAFSGVRETHSTQPAGTIREFNDSMANNATSSPSMSKISRVYSFKHLTMDEKGEEKLYWEVKNARPAEFDSWREALLWNSAHGQKLDSNLFQGIDGSPCPSAPNAHPVDDYKPSAPPFNPILFYEQILPHEAADFFKSYEQFIIDAGNIFLFDSLKSMPYLCGNCNCYACSLNLLNYQEILV